MPRRKIRELREAGVITTPARLGTPSARRAALPPAESVPPPAFTEPCETAEPTEEVEESVDALVGDLLAPGEDPASQEKSRLAKAKRDSTGFITDAVPHITAAQLRWLTYRLETGDDKEACTLSQTDPFDVLVWMADPGFRATYESALENKREGFKTLTAHLLPSVIRSLQRMLDTGSNKDKKEAAQLILRAQGLLIDKQSTTSPDAINTLFQLLREERPIEARIMDTRALPE